MSVLEVAMLPKELYKKKEAAREHKRLSESMQAWYWGGGGVSGCFCLSWLSFQMLRPTSGPVGMTGTHLFLASSSL